MEFFSVDIFYTCLFVVYAKCKYGENASQDHIIKLLGMVASQLGLKQKSIFDQLVEDEEILIKVAEGASGKVSAAEEHRQKTYVLSRRSLEVLDNVARQQNIPRDVLVEVSIKRLLPVMSNEQEKHRKRKLIYGEIRTFLDQGKKYYENPIASLEKRTVHMIF